MHRLAIASDAQVRTLSGQTHVLWGGGLDPDAYLDLWIELCRTDWVRDHATYYVLDDGDGNVLSSLKLYRPRLCWDGHESRIAALAGIFTPASLRRRGYARELIERVLEVAAEDGASLALLFSDIGTRYYRTLGFQELGADEHWMRISGATAGIPSSIELRSLTPAAVDDVVDAHRAYTEGRRFSIVRDKDHWDFILNRAQGFFRRLTGNRSRQRLEVAVRDGRFVGYLFSIEGAGEWNL
ncbi:MAG: GNAT family N-acetyltransferase, partial [Acidobacteriota bacterium]|nr:GNAT family N-acetyltransferase [Acidobacteriota bacterium]